MHRPQGGRGCGQRNLTRALWAHSRVRHNVAGMWNRRQQAENAFACQTLLIDPCAEPPNRAPPHGEPPPTPAIRRMQPLPDRLAASPRRLSPIAS